MHAKTSRRHYDEGGSKGRPMIALEFASTNWGSPQKAIAARSKKKAELVKNGYTVFLRTSKTLNPDYYAYQLVAIEKDEITPELPEKVFDGWEIVAKYLVNPTLHGLEIIDQTPMDKPDAERLAEEYRLDYDASSYSVWARRQRVEGS